MPPEILGPLGLLVAALVAVTVLWRDHLRADADDRSQRDTAIKGWLAEQEIVRKLLARRPTPRRKP